MKPVGLCLIDTGGHYLQGTTDITRTVPLGKLTEEEKKAYTLVLIGHLRLAAMVFKYGVTGGGLDIIAREPLWEYGMDFRHGTGHGVSYAKLFIAIFSFIKQLALEGSIMIFSELIPARLSYTDS